MHQVNRQAIVRYNTKNMFDLVNDVKSYPEFLKWCHDSHVIEKHTDSMIAGMTITLAGIKKQFTTNNSFKKSNENYQVELNLIKGPFENLTGKWCFTHLTENASKIELHLEFNFKSGFLNTTFKRAFGKIAQQLVSDFVTRASHVYG